MTVTLVAMGFGCALTFHQPAAFELGREHIGGFFICYAGTTIAFRLLSGSFPDRFGRVRAMYLALALFTLGLCMLAFPVAFILEPAGLVLGLGHAIFYPATNALVAAQLAQGDRAQMFAIYTAAFNLGIGGGVAVMGLIAERFGYSAVFMSVALCAVLAAVVARDLWDRTRVSFLFYAPEVLQLLRRRTRRA